MTRQAHVLWQAIDKEQVKLETKKKKLWPMVFLLLFCVRQTRWVKDSQLT